MRIKKNDIDVIKSATASVFGGEAKVYLFGSRTDDNKKGGDIDLYIETNPDKNLIKRKLEMLKILHTKLGEQKIDIIINDNTSADKYIYTVARNEGIAL